MLEASSDVSRSYWENASWNASLSTSGNASGNAPEKDSVDASENVS